MVSPKPDAYAKLCLYRCKLVKDNDVYYIQYILYSIVYRKDWKLDADKTSWISFKDEKALTILNDQQKIFNYRQAEDNEDDEESSSDEPFEPYYITEEDT